MSESFIPLETALQDEDCRATLLEKLREGAIASHAVESYGAELVEWCVTHTTEELVDKVFKTKLERRVIRRSLEEQRSSAKYIWAGSLGYLAVNEQAFEVVAFRSQSRRREGRCTVPKSVWQFAYIDESRCTVVYDDFGHLYRKEYMHVHIDDKAFQGIKCDRTDTTRQAGRKSKFRQDVADYAIMLMNDTKKYKLAEFVQLLKQRFGHEIGVDNTIIAHYSGIWREKSNLAPGRQKTQKPKIPNN